MKIRILLSIAMLGLVLVCADSAMAFTFNSADGDLSEWGVDPGASQWVPTESGVYSSPLTDPVYGTPEDTIGGGYQVYPGYGGQLFDAEALYLNWNDTTLYLALVTGFPDTTAPNYPYSAGDIAIDFGVNGTYDYGIEIGGHKTGYTGLDGNDGEVYENVTWYQPNVWGGVSSPLYMESADYTGVEADEFVYTLGYDNADPNYVHYVAEMAIPRSAFGSDWNDYMRVHWTESCGNDNINVTTTPVVPEPMSLSLLGLSLLGMIGAGIKKRK